jgi:hypothetical protein
LVAVGFDDEEDGPAVGPAEFLACFQAQAVRKPESSAARAIQSDLSTRIAANPLDA